MKITTLPVYSKLADEADVPLKVRAKLPDGWRLSQHQVETYKALTSNDYDVVFNTAMTGDGKSLAAYLPTLTQQKPLFAMYPTNELARDQGKQWEHTKADWRSEARVIPMSASRLEELISSGLHGKKADVIRHLADNNEIVLTNPDIFHYLAQFCYTRKDDAPDMLFSRKIIDLFDVFAFDEFHVFETPQAVSVLNALLLIREVKDSKRFLFLSATPEPTLQDYLLKAGFRFKLVQPQTEGWYQYTSTSVDFTQWRPIVQASDIHFWTTNADLRIEDWVDAHLEDILLSFFRRNQPGAKGAVIVNSVANAHRLYAKLEPAFKREGLSVSINTGFTGAKLKKESLNADLLIGTSTIDVGVDFRINFLVFESRDAGTFLQRLGRLGRHIDNERGNKFMAYEAHALTPAFVNERLFKGKADSAALLSEDSEVTREELRHAIIQAYPPPVSFSSYAREWGWVQSVKVYSSLNNKKVRDNYATALPRLKQHYWNTFGIAVTAKWGDYNNLWRTEKQILEEAGSFRGGSPFECGLIDDSETGGDSVKTYDLLSIAASANLQWLGVDEFKREAVKRGAALSANRLEELAGWFRFQGFSEIRHGITVLLRAQTAAWGAEEVDKARVIEGIELDVTNVDWCNDLNPHLRRRKFVATVCLLPPHELRLRLRLPPMFQLLEFRDRDDTVGSIAFARDALLLNVALKARRLSSGGGAIFA